MTDITGIMQAVKDALEARDRRIAELEKALASNMDRMLEHVEALEKAQADANAWRALLKSLMDDISHDDWNHLPSFVAASDALSEGPLPSAEVPPEEALAHLLTEDSTS